MNDPLMRWAIYSAVLTGLAVQIPLAIAVAWWLTERTIDKILKWSGAMCRFLAYCWVYKEFHVWLAQVPDRELLKDLYCQAHVGSSVHRERDELLEMTRKLPSHPEGYQGVCECQRCLDASCYQQSVLCEELC